MRSAFRCTFRTAQSQSAPSRRSGSDSKSREGRPSSFVPSSGSFQTFQKDIKQLAGPLFIPEQRNLVGHWSSQRSEPKSFILKWAKTYIRIQNLFIFLFLERSSRRSGLSRVTEAIFVQNMAKKVPRAESFRANASRIYRAQTLEILSG